MVSTNFLAKEFLGNTVEQYGLFIIILIGYATEWNSLIGLNNEKWCQILNSELKQLLI